MKSCIHKNIKCLNQFELIRKYECLDCGEVMMCECDKDIGTKHLAHQLSEGTELESQKRIPVTAGFQPNICRECRRLKPEPHPVAEIPGRTSKIRRYYWREIYFKELENLGDWAKENDIENPLLATGEKVQKARKKAREKAIKEIKKIHNENPKYSYSESSQAEVIKKFEVDLLDLKATYVKGTGEKKAQILLDGVYLTVENFVIAHFKKEGYESIYLESSPIHVLFGVYMWLLIQDPADPKNHTIGFGDRIAFEKRQPSSQIWTPLPSDFGSSGYWKRRQKAIEDHLNSIKPDKEELEWLFDYWLSFSENLRQYLWAHKENDIRRAKKLIRILPPKTILNILKYLIGNYWKRYTGWPDLLVFKNSDFIFIEVKSSNDSLSEDQKTWIQDNYNIMKLPFKLVKVHKENEMNI